MTLLYITDKTIVIGDDGSFDTIMEVSDMLKHDTPVSPCGDNYRKGQSYMLEDYVLFVNKNSEIEAVLSTEFHGLERPIECVLKGPVLHVREKEANQNVIMLDSRYEEVE